MTDGTVKPLAFTYLKNGYVQYRGDGLMCHGPWDVPRWRRCSRLLSSRVGYYVPPLGALALFCEALHRGRIQTTNGAWLGRNTSPDILAVLERYAKARSRRYARRQAPGDARERPGVTKEALARCTGWYEGYREGRRQKRRAA